MRASSADRDKTVEMLTAAYTEGRLTREELEERSARALVAQTYADLSSVVSDLPGGARTVQPYRPGYYPAERPVSGLATASLVCGIAEFFTGGLAAIPAIILGHMARSRIKRTGERGDGMALTGLVLGYLGIIAMVLIAIAGVVMIAHSGNSAPAGVPPFKVPPGIPPG